MVRATHPRGGYNLPVLRLPTGISLAGLAPGDGTPWSGGPRRAIDWAASLRWRGVQLDATVPGLRARELDRSARRDLASRLRRIELGFAGLDLWIPPAHFTDPTSVDRAVAAVASAVGLAGELDSLVGAAPGGRVVCVELPTNTPVDVVEHIGEAGRRAGVLIADHAWPPRSVSEGSAVRVGIDPAAVIAAGADPAVSVSRLALPPAAARLSDLAAMGRVPAGQGKLDRTAYEAALVTRGYGGWLVADLRELRDQASAAAVLAPQQITAS